MPKFSEYEKEQIQNRLITEGERLFTAHGIKKVTIDDLVEAVNIAKASFYTFYASKEYLYLDIVQAIQLKIFTKLNALLDTNDHLSGKERVCQVFDAMYGLMLGYPILAQINNVTVELIARKVSKERLDGFSGQNIDAVTSLINHGIKFSCDAKTASLAFQALYQAFVSLQTEDMAMRKAVSDILLHGVINQIVIGQC